MEQVLDISGRKHIFGVCCQDDPEAGRNSSVNDYDDSLRLASFLQLNFANWLVVAAGLRLHDAL
jgi:hypothetical protein